MRGANLTINPIDTTVTITGNNSTVDYDGENHSVSGYVAVAESALYNVENDFEFSYGTYYAGRNIAIYYMSGSGSISASEHKRSA